jgi:hypothetical protein
LAAEQFEGLVLVGVDDGFDLNKGIVVKIQNNQMFFFGAPGEMCMDFTHNRKCGHKSGLLAKHSGQNPLGLFVRVLPFISIGNPKRSIEKNVAVHLVSSISAIILS